MQAKTAHVAAEVEAGAIGESHVEHDQPGVLVAGVAHAAGPARFPVHGVALPAQSVAQALGDGRVVLDDKDRGVTPKRALGLRRLVEHAHEPTQAHVMRA